MAWPVNGLLGLLVFVYPHVNDAVGVHAPAINRDSQTAGKTELVLNLAD